MRIKELAERTETSPRLLRYYEQQGLLRVTRSANGYRDYDERFVEQVMHIRGLLEAGLPTRVIKQILPCLDNPADIHFADATPEIIATLEDQRDRMSQRIDLLTRNRDAMTRYLESLRGCARAV
ncbi:HTH-type transcriptional regulator glnR [Nocardia otitidiscaviarum]|uniref:HTH-type transcriptional regulator glnR n=1 Tax=Nocardia otitidiscaviarum TaxID=1823 RepID=A0A378YI68_9NOCA|nr:MerR family transcriptional regulator [Nocardia otitidiscaviarum]MBF6235880.1 MerR family transcriptional regulator [Nocardia otitidiscaviarum]SUA76433.1 HTH-type transcriptional regulator glnR [Nocardia otitidiscaviarum]